MKTLRTPDERFRDLPGFPFARSDKPAAREDYTYERQVSWMSAWLRQNDVGGATC